MRQQLKSATIRPAIGTLILAIVYLAMPGCAASRESQQAFTIQDERATAVLIDSYATDLATLLGFVELLIEHERTAQIGDIRRSIIMLGFIDLSGQANIDAFRAMLENSEAHHPLLQMVRDGAWSRAEAEQWLKDYAILSGFSDGVRLQNSMIASLAPIVEYDRQASLKRESFNRHAKAVESIAHEVLAARAAAREYAHRQGLSTSSLGATLDAIAEQVVFPSIEHESDRELARDLWREALEVFGNR